MNETSFPSIPESKIDHLPETTAELEEWATAQLSDRPDVIALMAALTKARLADYTTQEAEIVSSINAIRDEILLAGSMKFGIDLGDKLHDDENTKRRAIIEAAVRDTDLSDEDTLQRIGMVDEEGKFSFPAELFSSDTGKLWRRYMKYVQGQQEYFTMTSKGEALPITPAEMAAMELARTSEHNKLTRSVMIDLGVKDTPENLVFYRGLVAKMRDSAVPNTGEIKITAKRANEWYDNFLKNAK